MDTSFIQRIEIKSLSNLKREVIKTIFAIILFVAAFLMLLCFIFLIFILCGYLYLEAFATDFPILVKIALMIPVIWLAYTMFVLLKLLFYKHKPELNHLREITKKEEPALFELIYSVARSAGTPYPRKVYLNTDVNAFVFYESNFWSMFLPTGKNLVIGMGIINTSTIQELKSVLSHEFGHFSQKSLKLGSYVYHVNKVIYNILNNSESFEKIKEKWSEKLGIWAINAAFNINQKIQGIFRLLYEIVNKNYMSLSREMEFHADEIAAGISGSEPSKNALLRMTLSEHSYNQVLNFYANRISKNIQSGNIYKDHIVVMCYIAESNHFSFKNNLPEITLDHLTKYDKSKLTIKDQWASHPSLKDRITRIEQADFQISSEDNRSAYNIFTDPEATQIALTKLLFENVTYENEVSIISADEFIQEYKDEIQKFSFPKIYNSYYDNKNPTVFDFDNIAQSGENLTLENLFSEEKTDWVYTSIALQNDIETLNNIANKTIPIRSFEYDGFRHKAKNAEKLREELKKELEILNDKIKRNDCDIYLFFREIESRTENKQQLNQLYRDLFEFEARFDAKYNVYADLSSKLQFISVTTPFAEIRRNLKNIKPLEKELRDEIGLLLKDETLISEITEEIKEHLEKYCSREWEYFQDTSYLDDHLNILYNAMHNFGYIMSRKYFIMKMNLLRYQEELIKTVQD